jgi:hypothetical protein
VTARRAAPAIAIAVLAALAACARPTESEIRTAGQAPRDIVAAAPAVHCYTTLAEKECFTAPVPGQGYRAHPGLAPVARP